MPHYHKYLSFVNKSARIFLLSLPIILGFSCASTKRTERQHHEVHLTDRAVVRLLPPQFAGRNLQMHQSLTGAYGSQTFQMDAFLILNRDEINAVFMNPFGTTMGSLRYTADSLEFESSVLPQKINPAYIAFDFQLCFYDETALRQELGRAGLQLKTESAPGKVLREVYDGETLLISILQEEGKVAFSNIHRGYSYTIHGDFNGSE